MMRHLRSLTLPLLALFLAACGTVEVPSERPLEAVRQTSKLTECQALYADSSTGPRVGSNLSYGDVGTLILSFAEDASKARAVDWMGSNLGLSLGENLGVLENLPVVAIRTLVTRDLVETLTTAFGNDGLLSIWQDEPLRFFLAESVPLIGADAAREAFGLDGSGVGVAVIDSGIDATHGDLVPGENVARNVKIAGSVLDQPIGGYLYLDLQNTDLTSGHGTHVAGTIAGLGRASNGRYVGVAPGASLVGVGTGDGISILYALQGFDFVMKPEVREAHNIRIISNSWGTSGRFAPFDPISLATKRAYDLGMLVVFAAGNEGPGADTLNPYSASPCAISVAAGDKQGVLADFSSRGIPGDAYHKPDITAPGVSIVAARALTGAVTPPYSGDLEYGIFYSSISGTSMATPHVSGTLALMLQGNPGLTLEGALDILRSTARPMYERQEDGTVRAYEEWEVGAGYLDAYEAVRQAVRQNRDRYELSTTSLDSWQGSVPASLCAPLLGCATAGEHRHAVEVPSGAVALRISATWALAAEDLDLYVYDPAGSLIASSASLNVPEEVSVPNPAAGSWTVVVEGYLNGSTSYEGTAEADFLVRRR